MSKIQDKTFDIVKILLCVLVYLVSALVVIQLLKLKLFRENLLWPMIWGIAFLDLGLTALMFFFRPENRIQNSLLFSVGRSDSCLRRLLFLYRPDKQRSGRFNR